MKDKMTVLNILGCLIKKPDLLLEDNYRLEIADFPERFHKIVFATINNMVGNGVKKLDSIEIDSFISQYDKQYKVFSDNEGIDFLEQAQKLSNLSNFDYYYTKLKKISLLNEMEQLGFDTTEIYDEDEMDFSLREQKQIAFDKMSLEEILETLDGKVTKLRETYSRNTDIVNIQAGEKMKQLKEEYKTVPEMGMPSGSALLNTIQRGLRLKKFYLRSSPSGVGKTRMGVGDICALSIGKYYDWGLRQWVETNISEPTLFIATEQEKDEIQTLVLANISGVAEELILDAKYDEEQEKIIDEAIEIIENAPLWIEEQASFSIDDIENCIKRNKIEHGIGYVFFDYIFMSVKMLTEISKKTRGVNLREDNVLYMFSDKMKELANTLNLHISSSSQLNGNWEHVRDANQNLLRGAKSLADKLDVGVVVLRPTEADMQAIKPVIEQKEGFYPEPNLVYHIYKIRRGKLNNIKLWINFDYGTCRTTDLFVTTNDYKIIDVEATTIEKILEMTEDTRDFSDEDVINLEEDSEFKF